MKSKKIKYLISFVIALLTEIFIAIYVHDEFIRPYVGDILIVICVYLLAKIIFGERVKYLSLYVLLFAISVEVLQYFNLAQIIAPDSRIINIALGSTFDIKDILCYIAGYLIILMGEIINKRRKRVNED